MNEQVPVVVDDQGMFQRLMTVRDVLAPDLSISELQLFALVAERSGLDPFARQIYAVKRGGRMTIQTGIDGYRSIAVRTGEYDGQDEPVYGPPCDCGRGEHPQWATVKVYRKGMSRPVAATAWWHEYVPDPGPNGRGDAMWRRMPHVMIAKVAEALALRKAFPWDPTRGTGIGGDVYTAEEMAQADRAEKGNEPSIVDRIAVGDGEGLALREFAERVSHLDPSVVRAKRDEMFPGARSVSELTPEQRLALAEALTVADAGGEVSVEVGVEAEAEEPLEEDAPLPEEADDDRPVWGAVERIVKEEKECPPSPVDGAPCDRVPGHSGVHRSRDLRQSW